MHQNWPDRSMGGGGSGDAEAAAKSPPDHREAEATDWRRRLRLLSIPTRLRELRPQLHHAADRCEAAFLKDSRKKMVIQNTKSYICQAIVTVIDHLGTVTSKLERRLSRTDEISQTEQIIDCLQQRLLTCQHYALSLDLSTMRWNANFPKHHRHFVLPSFLFGTVDRYLGKSNDDLRRHGEQLIKIGAYTGMMVYIQKLLKFLQKRSVTISVGLPIFNGDAKVKINGTELAAAVPLFDGKSLLSRSHKHSSVIQSEGAFFVLRSEGQKKKPVHGSNLLSFLGMSKRRT